ncbi:MAG: divalent-cation tolerance protein CutA [Desulfobacteraceae bacterium]|nr:divalent-cation tolerance protein CutA [Desulfobacteraceae bacterium]
MEYCIILTTCPNDDEANSLASKLIKEKLAACVQLTPIKSYYSWKNEQHIDPEIKLLIKTRTKLYESVEQLIKKSHSYDVPQIVQIPINDGSDQYLDWIDENTTD